MRLKSFDSSKITGNFVFVLTCIIPLFFLPLSDVDAFRMPKFALWAASLFTTILFLYLGGLRSKVKPHIEVQPVVSIILGFYLLTWVVSTVFSEDIATSITGYPLYNGLIQMIMCIITFYLIISFFRFQLLNVNSILYAYCFIALYCLLQFYGIDPFVKYYGMNVLEYSGQVFATIGNQNQVATCMAVIFVIAAFLYILSDDGIPGKRIFLFSAFLTFAGILATRTRGGWLAAACTVLIAFPFIIKNPAYLRRYILIFTGCAFITLLMDLTSGGVVLTRISSLFSEGNAAVSGNLDGGLGSGRMEIWLNSIDLVKNYWLFGSGPDTFPLVYNRGSNLLVHERLLALSPHNESLRLLITTGIFSLVGYWAFVVIIIKKGVQKAKENKDVIPFLLGIVCYLIKGMFNCSVVTDMILFWVLAALVYAFEPQKKTSMDKLMA